MHFFRSGKIREGAVELPARYAEEITLILRIIQGRIYSYDELHVNPVGGFHIGDGVNFFDDVKEWPGPIFDAHQLGIRLNFGVDVKKAAVDVKKT